MPKKPDNTNSAPARQAEASAGRTPTALILAIFFVALLIAGGMFLWFNIAGARTATMAFLQRIEPESVAQETWVENQFVLLSQRETAIDERERLVTQREKDQDAKQMTLEKREKAFMALQEDPDSPIYQNALYLAEVYADLTPEKAAELLVTIDDLDQIKRIMSNMDNATVTAIIELMPIDFGADLTLAILGEPSY